jgi:ferritin-like metal-binding protein YciE
MELNALHDLYVEQLKDMYSAEKQLVEALPKMAEGASTPALRQAFEMHFQETENHLQEVRNLLSELGENPGSKVCKGMQGLVEEGNEVLKQQGRPKARDAGLILAAQKVEHYEIASYGGLRAYARVLGYDAAASTLNEILDQEYETDQKLDDLAEGGILAEGLNEQAA